MAKESRFISWKGQKLFSPQHSDWLNSPSSLLVNGHQGLFPREKAVRLYKANHPLHPEPMSLMHSAMLSIPHVSSTHGAD